MNQTIIIGIIGIAVVLIVLLILFFVKQEIDYRQRRNFIVGRIGKIVEEIDASKKSWSPFDPLVPLYHDKGEGCCNQIAFSSHGKFKPGEVMESARCILPNGLHPVSNFPMTCGSCGKQIYGAPIDSLSYHEEDTPCL